MFGSTKPLETAPVGEENPGAILPGLQSAKGVNSRILTDQHQGNTTEHVGVWFKPGTLQEPPGGTAERSSVDLDS